ncbi:choice-of-anchor D domain-containing protein [Cystobacter fuscus]
MTDDITQRELNFGNVNVGARLVRSVTLQNTGDAELSLNGFTVEPSTPQFRPQIPSKTTLRPNETVELPVEFVPTANGLVSADLKVTANITGGFMTFPLRGNGLSANIGLSVASLNFNEQKLQQASARKSLTISSSGEAQLVINRIELSAGYAFEPAVTLPTTETPWVLAPKTGLRTLELVFRPTTLGPAPGTLRVYSNAINSIDPVTLTGTGVDGVGQTTPQREFSFADTLVGATVRATIRVENSGGYPLRLLNATSTSASVPNPFAVVNFEANRVLQKNNADYSEFFVDFVPTFHGAHKGTLVIETDSVTVPSISLAMSGNALGPEAFLTTTGPVNFGKINVQATAKAQLSVKNTGQGTLTIQDIAFSNKVSTDGGTSSPDDPSQIFAVGPSADGGLALPMDVAAQQIVSIPLTFKPIAMGVREAVVTVKSNARDVSKDAVGEGTAPILKMLPTSLEFKGILVGNYSQAQTITVKNEGNGSVEIDSITMSSNGSDVFIVQPVVTPYLLYPNAELPISVTFQPTAERTSAEVQLIVTPVTGYRVPAVSARLVGKGILEPISVESELEYGKQLINNPAVRVLHIGNATGEPITFIRATVDSAPGCSQFRSDPAQAGGFTVEPFETKELRILFTPLAEGPLNCNLKLEFGQFREKLPVALHGEGIRAVLSVNTTTLDFGSLRAGVDRRVERIALRNLSSDTVKLAEPEETSITGERFKIDLLSLKDRLLEPDVPFYVDVEYQPQGETLSKSTLLFGTKEPLLLRSVEVQLAGKATKQILAVDQTDLDFGRVDVNADPVSKTITITNGSSQAQRVLVNMEKPTWSPFSTNVGASGLDIPAQGTATFTVSFDPSDSGSVEDKVLIKLQDSSTADVVLRTTGAGRTLSGQGNGLGVLGGRSLGQRGGAGPADARGSALAAAEAGVAGWPSTSERSSSNSRRGLPRSRGFPPQQESWDRSEEFFSALAAAHVGRGAPLKSRVGQHYDFFHDAVVRHANTDRIALRLYDRRSGWQVLGYRQLHEQAARRATEWARQGVKAGAKVCLLYPVGSELLISFAAALGLGACVSLLPPQGRRFIAHRLTTLAPDHIATEPHQTLLVAGFEKKVLQSKGQAAPAFTSHTAKPDEPVGLLFSPLVEPAGTPSVLTAEDAWRGALVDGLLTFGLGPGEHLCAPGYHPLQHLPAFLLTTLLRGATYLHLELADLETNPALLTEHPVRALGVTPALRICCCARARRSRTWPTGSAIPRSPSTGWRGAPGSSSAGCPRCPPPTCSWILAREARCSPPPAGEGSAYGGATRRGPDLGPAGREHERPARAGGPGRLHAAARQGAAPRLRGPHARLWRVPLRRSPLRPARRPGVPRGRGRSGHRAIAVRPGRHGGALAHGRGGGPLPAGVARLHGSPDTEHECLVAGDPPLSRIADGRRAPA